MSEDEPTQLNILAEQQPVFACVIDESAGLAEDEQRKTQLTDLPGDTWEDLFRD